MNRFTEEDKKAKVVMVLLSGKKEAYPYIPHSLEPVLDREYLKKVDPYFSIDIDKLIKMEMPYRFQVLEDFIKDIAPLNRIGAGKVEFSSSRDISNFNLIYKKIMPPVLIGGKGRLNNKNKIFTDGYYKKPEGKVKIGLMYPKGMEEDSKEALRKIWTFNINGGIKDSKGKIHKNLSLPGLVDLKFEELETSAYTLGDITEYKKTAYSLKKTNVDLILCVIPDYDEEDKPYNAFKEVLAELKIPSQMISGQSVKKINDFNGERTGAGLYYIYNISLGMLGKSGGIPWVIDNMNSKVDCFVGLDVGNPDRNEIRFPSCSVVFNRDGTLINYFRPRPQKGEIIGNKILQDTFDRVIISYNEKYGKDPSHIVIHRDGFARENIEWYKNYFGKKNIRFDMVEVKKNGAVRFGAITSDGIYNPEGGTYLTDGQIAYLVTTNILPNINSKNRKGFFGSPHPLKIQRIYGETELDELVKQIYYLSEIHVGSTKSTRLPVTTEYADRISKFVWFIPEGEVDNRLFFL